MDHTKTFILSMLLFIAVTISYFEYLLIKFCSEYVEYTQFNPDVLKTN